MATAIKLSQRVPSKSLINKLCYYSNRTIATLNHKWHFHPSSTKSITFITKNDHICSHNCNCHLLKPNTVNHKRLFSTTQDKDNDENDKDEQQETEEEDEEDVESDEADDNEQINELNTRIQELEAEVTKYKEALARSHADIINIQNMGKKDVESARKFAIKGFSKDMLNVADSLDGCINVVEQHLNDYKHEDNKLDENIKSVIEGVKITQNTLLDTFGRHGINKIESMGKEFDPNVHEALFKQPTDEHPEDHVVQVISQGYTIKDAVLRAAKVGVSAKPPQSSNTEETKE